MLTAALAARNTLCGLFENWIDGYGLTTLRIGLRNRLTRDILAVNHARTLRVSYSRTQVPKWYASITYYSGVPCTICVPKGSFMTHPKKTLKTLKSADVRNPRRKT